MKDYTIIDNFLSKEEHKIIKDIFMSHNTPWYFSNKVATLKDDSNGFYFYHVLYANNEILSSNFKKISFLYQKIKPLRALLRVKANLYTSTKKLIVHTPHIDFPFKHSGFIYSINTCDGFTKIGKDKIQSLENRALFFNSAKEHSSTTCTDKEARFNININYIE
jgi:hypothetical protein